MERTGPGSEQRDWPRSSDCGLEVAVLASLPIESCLLRFPALIGLASVVEGRGVRPPAPGKAEVREASVPLPDATGGRGGRQAVKV